ncbi:phage scaffolding protein [Companilactobacillus jidongensis]|uniref:phage scaffolding protein n=1 Tax=Companilactobacillus jidongensis TaxID=2486006 RepID=UPI000F78C78A|nr:hypothetical protein [Companilactobacillus jidongensis]
MKREFLKDLGLTDDSIDKMMSEYGKDIQGVNSKLASAKEQRDSFKPQIDDYLSSWNRMNNELLPIWNIQDQVI